MKDGFIIALLLMVFTALTFVMYKHLGVRLTSLFLIALGFVLSFITQ